MTSDNEDENVKVITRVNGHEIYYCTLCEYLSVICKYCGNNACNGGSGNLPNGDPCPDKCNEAYKILMEINKNEDERTEEISQEILESHS